VKTVSLSQVCDELSTELCRSDSIRPGVRIWSAGREWHVPLTTVAVGPKPGGGEMVADISRFKLGDSVRVLGDEGMDYRATIGGKP
jgi:hypothetical protein